MVSYNIGRFSFRCSNRVNNSKVPLSAYQDFSAFKLYLLDVGLLSAMAGIDAKTLLEG